MLGLYCMTSDCGIKVKYVSECAVTTDVNVLKLDILTSIEIYLL